MCGILFIAQDTGGIDREAAEAALALQRWRGPDACSLLTLAGGRVHLGHNRLAIIDPGERANQPMRSADGRHVIVFNGEIYNHRALRERHALATRTASDTEVLLQGYALRGEAFFDELEGMYAFVIHDTLTGGWVAARDPLGIKPLHLARQGGTVCLASEPRVVAQLLGRGVDAQSVQEWRLIRRPAPGHSFFAGVHEVPPGTLVRHDGSRRRFWQLRQRNDRFEQAAFEALLQRVVSDHEMSDVRNVALLSGGIDSALITALSGVPRAYSIGLDSHNELEPAAQTATALGRELVPVTLTQAQLHQQWRDLARLRGEPLGLPNEGLIHAVCQAMRPEEKVVLTGEGADELMFGYDGLYRWALAQPATAPLDVPAFLARYGYSDTSPTPRLLDQLLTAAEGLHPIDAVEDFFYHVHLPGLLRRMDFASMAASKEARVPFADRRLVEYAYRLPAAAKLDGIHAKLPLRQHLQRLGLDGPLQRPKIGFSAQASPTMGRHAEYRVFQDLILEALSWS
jgi:asparagine synthase (glutamine-hydrolysing)